MTIRVLLVDDHAMVRAGLRALLSQDPETYEVVGEAGNATDAISAARSSCPDIALIDMELPGLGGAAIARSLAAEHTDLGIIGLSMYSEYTTVQEMLNAGAKAYVLKKSGYPSLKKAITAVSSGRHFLDEDVVGAITPGWKHQSGQAEHADLSVLTVREREVLKLMADGFSTQAIAGELGVTLKTAQAHKRNLQLKLGTRSVAELTKIAIRQKLARL